MFISCQIFFFHVHWILVCQWFAVGRWSSLGTPVSSTNKTDHHDNSLPPSKHKALICVSCFNSHVVNTLHIIPPLPLFIQRCYTPKPQSRHSFTTQIGILLKSFFKFLWKKIDLWQVNRHQNLILKNILNGLWPCLLNRPHSLSDGFLMSVNYLGGFKNVFFF